MIEVIPKEETTCQDDTISRAAAIDALCTPNGILYPIRTIENLPSAQPESYKEKLKEIADALSEKFAYMHTCLNERDIILGYLGVKHSNEIHCNTDCTNAKCESYHFNKRLPSVEPELIRCQDCKFGLGHAHNVKCDKYYGMGGYDDFCSRAERREDEQT